jgi:alkanesulfonate monooxygenase SsuD/methylene tetrahydromethanopterin reductase-like flavin-dependent oxidoreductase (luciferase family)
LEICPGQGEHRRQGQVRAGHVRNGTPDELADWIEDFCKREGIRAVTFLYVDHTHCSRTGVERLVEILLGPGA